MPLTDWLWSPKRNRRRTRCPRQRAHLALERLEERTLLAAGDLDVTFDIDGRVTTDFGGAESVAGASVQPDGKIVVAGTRQLGTLDTRAFLVARYNPDGTLDDGSATDSTPGDFFGAAGRTIITFPAGHARAAGLALQADGRMVVVGTAGFATSEFAIARLNSDGTLDDGSAGDLTPNDRFGADGRVTFGFGRNVNEGKGVVIQADGKIVVAGTAAFGASPTEITFGFARLNIDGSLDDGTASDSTPRDEFGTAGKRLMPLGLYPGVHTVMLADVVAQPDGRIVAAGRASTPTSDSIFAVARIDADGAMDQSFGRAGLVTAAVSPFGAYATSVAVEPDGKIVAGGSTSDGRAFVLSRYLPDGDLDTDPDVGFGMNGVVTTDFSSDQDQLFDLLIQPDGRIVAAGMARNPRVESFGDFAVARYDFTGQLDLTFGDADPADPSLRTGKLVTDFGAAASDFVHDEAHAVVLTSRGLVVAGNSQHYTASTLRSDMALARYDAGGSVHILRSPTPGVARSFGFSLAADGNILAVGDPEAQGPVLNLGTGTVGRAYTFDWTTGNGLGLPVGPRPVYNIADPFDPYHPPHYGLSVAVIDNVVAVGAPGAATVYFADAYGGQQLGSRKDANGDDDYGAAVAAVDRDPVVGLDSFVVGAPRRQDDGSGDLRLFRLKPGPTFEDDPARVVKDEWASFDFGSNTYGEAVATVESGTFEVNEFGFVVSGWGRLLVGDPGADTWGRAYLLNAGTGSAVLTLNHPAPHGSESFGAAVAGFGTDLLVAAPADSVSAVGAGAVYLFDGTTGALVRTFLNPSPDPQDHFGFAIASLGNYVLIGAPNDDSLGQDAGAVYVFDGVTGELVRSIFSPEPRAFANFGFSLVALGADSFGVGAPSLVLSSDGGAVYIFDIGLPVGAPRSGVPFEGVVQGVVWDDRDADGIQDPGEPGLAGRKVFWSATRDYGFQPFVWTDLGGRYELRFRTPGGYTINEDVPPGWSPTAPEALYPDMAYVETASLPWESGTSGTLTGADLNADGRTDLISVGGSVVVYWNDPSAPNGFQSQLVSDVGLVSDPALDASEAFPADMDGDGLPDLVIRLGSGTETHGPLAILLNAPQAPRPFILGGFAGSLGPPAQDVVAADFNGDGRNDLALTQSNSVQVLLQNAIHPNTFLPPINYQVPFGAIALATGDLNNDGLPDLVASYDGQTEVDGDNGFVVLLNSATLPGTFSLPVDFPTQGFVLMDLAVADVNQDGRADLIAADPAIGLSTAGAARVFLNDPAAPGTFRGGVRYWRSGEARDISEGDIDDVRRVIVIDANQDGLPDVAYGARDGEDHISLLHNRTSQPGTFFDPFPFDHAVRAHGLGDFWVGDLDGDRSPELVYATTLGRFGDRIHVATLRPTFPGVFHTSSVTVDQPTATANFGNLLDYDGDGVTDAEERIGLDADANDDGIPDARQPYVATLPNAVDGRYVTLNSAPFSRLLDVRASSGLPAGGGGPAGADFPVGFFSFTVDGIGLGGGVYVGLNFHDSEFAATTYFKFGPTADNPTPHWYEFLWDGTPGGLGAQLIDDNNNGLIDRVVLHLRDLGLGDHSLSSDGSLASYADGRIVDPGGPAVRLAAPTVDSVVIDDGSAQRSRVKSITVNFDTVVTLDPGAFELRRENGRLVKLHVALSVVGDKTVGVLTFDGKRIIGGSLRDGGYTLTIRGDRVKTASGLMLDGDGDSSQGGDRLTTFQRRFGDADGDGDVDRRDRRLFRGTRGKHTGDPGYLEVFDFDGDGDVDREDRGQFRRRLSS